jgi:hypothetical protein
MGGNTRLWNVDILKQNYKAPYHRKLTFSYLPPWEPEMSLSLSNLKPRRFKSSFYFRLQVKDERATPFSGGTNFTRGSNRVWFCPPPVTWRKKLYELPKDKTNRIIIHIVFHHRQKSWCFVFICKWNWNSRAGAVIRLWSWRPGFDSRQGNFFSTTIRPDLGTNQPLIQWVPWFLLRE